MKKIILLIALTLGALQGNDIVHYDANEAEAPISKPNHPTTDIH